MDNLETMEKPLSILLIEDDPAACRQFVQYVEETQDVRLIGVTNNTDKALEYVNDYLPDAIILDLELHKGSGNGVSFLLEMDKAHLPFSPYVLVTTDNISAMTHEQVRRLGADFVMVKAQPDYSAESAVEFLRMLKGVIHDSRKKTRIAEGFEPETPAETQKRLFTQVAAEIDLIGVSPKAIGRDYLVDAIILLIEGKIEGRAGTHIAAVAKKYNKTDSSVERAMQNAINRAWANSDIEELHRYYTARITSEKGVPTLTEFIFYYANKMKTK